MWCLENSSLIIEVINIINILSLLHKFHRSDKCYFLVAFSGTFLASVSKTCNDNDIQICWVPSHTGICGNDQADKAARSTITLTTEKKFKIPHTDFKMKINNQLII